MRNLKLLATVLFVAVLLVGIVLLLRQTNTQNDTSVTSTTPISGQQLAAKKVSTDPPVKKIRTITPSSITVGAKKIDPRKTTPAAEQAQTNRTVLTGNGVSLSSIDKNTGTSELPRSKADKQINVGKIDRSQMPVDIGNAKRNAVRNLRKGKLNTNNNNQ